MATSPHTRQSLAVELLRSVDRYTATTRHPLRPYQLECARAITRSAIRQEGKTFTVLFARQMGKNETSAQIEAYLMALHAAAGGTIVKTAPSFKPQIINSLLRLRQTLDDSPLTRERWKPAFGYILDVGRARTMFLSADPNANVVGATASLLLEVDEAQDVDPDKYSREFRPMASSTNATTVLYGTAWSDSSLLEQQRLLNRETEASTGERLNFEYTWEALARVHPPYRAFVEAEIARLGIDHPSIRTQYLLETISDAGRLFSLEQRTLLAGSHSRRAGPSGSAIVWGIDVGGEDEEAEDAHQRGLVPRRDSTVLTIGETVRQADGQLATRILHHVWWTGKDLVAQFDEFKGLWQRWQPVRLAIDASGIGAGLAAMFTRAYGEERVDEVVFTAQRKSELAYELLAQINTLRMTVYEQDGSREYREFWSQVERTRYRLRVGNQLAWEVPPSEGHDDFVSSLALLARAAAAAAPEPFGGLARAEGYEADVNW